jgi:hypothetical protein
MVMRTLSRQSPPTQAVDSISRSLGTRLAWARGAREPSFGPPREVAASPVHEGLAREELRQLPGGCSPW